MAWKFLNIGKANARIDELESQVTTITKERDEARAAISTNSSEIEAEHQATLRRAEAAESKTVHAESDLATAKASIASQGKEIEELKLKLAAKESEVKIQVARQAAEIQAQLGQPPQPIIPKDRQAASGVQATGIMRVLAAAKADLERAGYERTN